MRGNYKSLRKGDKSDGCSKKTSLYISCLVLFIILEDLMLDGQKDNDVISAGWLYLYIVVYP